MRLPRSIVRFAKFQSLVEGPAVLVLALSTLVAGLFLWKGNRSEIDLLEHLQGSVETDSGVNRGTSRATFAREGGSWVFRYELRKGFDFPYAGAILELSPEVFRRTGTDWRTRRGIRIESRFLHPADPNVRFWIRSHRMVDGRSLLVPHEILLSPSREWTSQFLDLDVVRLPNWYIGQNRIAPLDQAPDLGRIQDLMLMTPELLPLGDTGRVEVRRLVLEGPRVDPLRLVAVVLVAWMIWATSYLAVRWSQWRGRLRVADGRARHAEELAQAKSDFLATMSHEIRTPLNGLLVPAQLLLTAKLEPEDREHVRTILESGTHLMSIVQDALDFAKIEAGKIQLERIPLALPQLMDSVRRNFEDVASSKGVDLVVSVDPSLPQAILGDPVRLRQVLLNLVSNSLKFTDVGTVSVEVLSAGSSVAPMVEFCVTDTGIGMDRKTAQHLFERFLQADASTTRLYGGTGLGLAIAKGLVEAMGGRIEVESSPGAGSSFRFRVPRIAAGVPAIPESDVPETLSFAGTRVLVVDDNEVNRRVALALLRRMGFEVHLASSGEDALQALLGKEVDLLLLDCHMPGMDGFEVARTVRSWAEHEDDQRRCRAHLPIIALTADALVDIRQRCMASGMDGVVTKPFRKETLASELAAVRSARGS